MDHVHRVKARLWIRQVQQSLSELSLVAPYDRLLEAPFFYTVPMAPVPGPRPLAGGRDRCRGRQTAPQ